MDISEAFRIESDLRQDGGTGLPVTSLRALLMVIDDLRATNRSLLEIVNEPDPAIDECGKAVDLYRQHLPMCRGVEAMTSSRRRSLIARWREFQKGKPREARQEFLEFWEAVFKHAAKSDFLTGRRSNDRGWVPTIDFFLQRSSLVKLREGAYHPDDAPRAGGMFWI